MGNQDGILNAMTSRGSNKVIDFDGGFFSFAFGNEIALVLAGKHYILNCNDKLWDEVKVFLAKKKTNRDVLDFWVGQSNARPISQWSDNFSDISK